MGRLMHPLFLAALLGGLIGCTSADNTAPLSPTQRVAAVPTPAATERPPVPKRKPPIPGAQQASATLSGSDSTAVPEPAAAPETRVAAIEPAPSTPEMSSSVPNDLVGMDSSVIEQSLGPPESRRDVPPAVVWQYANDACGLDVWLYRDLQSGALRALFVEVKGDDRTDQRRQFCIKQLALQSGGGNRRADPDEAAPR